MLYICHTYLSSYLNNLLIVVKNVKFIRKGH